MEIGHRDKKYLLVAVFVLCFAVSQNLYAKETSDAWEFTLAPYVWLAGQKGTVGTFPGLPAVDVDIDFWDDVVDNLNGAVFVIFEARKKKYGGYLRGTYIDIEDEDAGLGALPLSVISRTKSWMVDLGGQYRLIEDSGWFIDGVAGVRFYSVESSLDLKGQLGAAGLANTKNWADPLLGFKARKNFAASPVFINGIVGIGGFGAGSDLMWDVMVNLGYAWSDAIATTLGYRYLDIDYKSDTFRYDISQSGPVLALVWDF